MVLASALQLLAGSHGQEPRESLLMPGLELPTFFRLPQSSRHNKYTDLANYPPNPGRLACPLRDPVVTPRPLLIPRKCAVAAEVHTTRGLWEPQFRDGGRR